MTIDGLDSTQPMAIGQRISVLVDTVFNPVEATMRSEAWASDYQAIFWQALAREAMVRSQGASREARDARRRQAPPPRLPPARGEPNDA